MKHLFKTCILVLLVSFLVFCIAFTIAKLAMPGNLERYENISRKVVRDELEKFRIDTGICLDLPSEN